MKPLLVSVVQGVGTSHHWFSRSSIGSSMGTTKARETKPPVAVKPFSSELSPATGVNQQTKTPTHWPFLSSPSKESCTWLTKPVCLGLRGCISFASSTVLLLSVVDVKKNRFHQMCSPRCYLCI